MDLKVFHQILTEKKKKKDSEDQLNIPLYKHLGKVSSLRTSSKLVLETRKYCSQLFLLLVAIWGFTFYFVLFTHSHLMLKQQQKKSYYFLQLNIIRNCLKKKKSYIIACIIEWPIYWSWILTKSHMDYQGSQTLAGNHCSKP